MDNHAIYHHSFSWIDSWSRYWLRFGPTCWWSSKFVVAAELLTSLSEKFGWADASFWQPTVVKNWTISWQSTLGYGCRWAGNPGDHVTTDSGTGIVHKRLVCDIDYNVGVANGLEVACNMDERKHDGMLVLRSVLRQGGTSFRCRKTW